MAYYIFLKSLRSLQEFRKNPHVKIPPKSSSTIFQSLAKFKNPILIRKSFYFLSLLLAQPACLSPTRPWPTGRPKPPGPPAHLLPSPQAGPSLSARASLAYSRKYVFLFETRLPSVPPSLSSLADMWTPHVSPFFSTAPAATPAASPPPRLAPPHRLASRAPSSPRNGAAAPPPPRLPRFPSPPFLLRAETGAIDGRRSTSRRSSTSRPSGPIKGATTPPAIFTALNSTPLSSPSCPEHLLVELAPPPPPFADARPSEPLHQLVPPGVRIPIRSSCSPRRHGEVPSTGTPARPHSGELRPCAIRGSTMDRALSGPRVHRPGSPHFPYKNNLLFI